jgi:phage-related protein
VSAVKPRSVGSAIIATSKREARVLFGFHDGMLIALHAFIKKTQQASAEDLASARQRLKEVTS